MLDFAIYWDDGLDLCADRGCGGFFFSFLAVFHVVCA